MSTGLHMTIRARRPGMDLYQVLRELLLRYASSITVDSMLTAACKKARVTPPVIDVARLELLIQELSPGIRTFCVPKEIPKLMLELADLME
jgi:hypothetical protein